MNRRIVILALFLICLSLAINAQNMNAVWVDGNVLVYLSNGARSVDIGDRLPIDSQVELESGALLELEFNGSRIFLSSEGRFLLRRLYSAASEGNSTGVLGGLSRRLQNLQAREENLRSSTATAGVRADRADESDLSWASGDVDQLFSEGLAAVANGDIDGAYFAFEEAYFSAPEQRLSEASYYLGYAAVLRGNLSEGRELYDEVSFSPEERELQRYFTVSNAELYIKAGEPEKAVEILGELIGDAEAPAIILQQAYYFRAMAYAAAGDRSRRNADLQRVTDINADRNLTAAAEELLWD